MAFAVTPPHFPIESRYAFHINQGKYTKSPLPTTPFLYLPNQ